MTKKNINTPKILKIVGKTLQWISPRLATRFAAQIFITPIRHKIPFREIHMDYESEQNRIFVEAINKEIVVYKYGKSKKIVLLVHGWSGRGTQLVKIADELIINGYSTVSFDAPAHGKSGGKTTMLTEFIESVLIVEKNYGPFEFAIGHSLGGITILNAIRNKLKLKKAVIIGSGDIIQDIIEQFINKLEMNPNIAIQLKNYFETKTGYKMDDFSSFYVAKNIPIPILIIHDKNDEDVPVKAAHNIHNHLPNSILYLTEGLGHRKILGNNEVIKKIINFFKY